MKKKPELWNRIVAVFAGLVMSGAPGLAQAGSTIFIGNFDNASDTNNWSLLDPQDGAIDWDGTTDAGGTSAKGALKLTLAGGTGAIQIQPQFTLGTKSFNSSNFWSLSFDIKVDPSSGLTSSGADYGHIQAVLRNSAFSWNGINWTLLDTSATNWQHMELPFLPSYDDVAYLAFQLQGDTYSGDVIFWLDNIQINPIPYDYVYTQFTNAVSTNGWTWANWSQPGTLDWTASPDAGGGSSPGSMKLNCDFLYNPTNYQQVVFSKNFDMDQNHFTYMDLDVKLDPASYPMFSGSSYGSFEVILAVEQGWTWKSLGAQNLTSSNTNWTHLSFPVGGLGTNMHALILKLGGGWTQDGFTNSVILYVDNIRFWTPQVTPTLSLARSGPGGLQIASTAPTDDWQRQNIVTPAATRNYTWVNAGQPVTYSFTLTNYPDPVAHPGFEAHVYLVNYDTLKNPGFDETYSGVDWNASDLVDVKLQNNGGGGVDFSFNFKTNLPGANVDQTVATIHDANALGTWAVTFNDNTSITLTTASGSKTNFSITTEQANAFFAQMTLHFGTFKNRIINNGAIATFSRIQVTGALSSIDETFPGPGLNPDSANPFWRIAADPNGLTWIPEGTAWWLSWTVPDTGFTVQSAPTITGPWADAGVTYIAAGSTSKSGAVPQAALPAGNAAVFRLIKPNP
jgi:hypothetical protein